MKTQKETVTEKLDILDNLIVWSSHALTKYRYENEEEAIESLDLIIKAIKDPKVLEDLEEVRSWAGIPF